MARCPFAAWKRLPGDEPAIVPRTVIFHTMVLSGGLFNCDAYFRSGRSGGIESHFGVGGHWGADADHDLDGAIWQWRDTEEQADANRQANAFAVSIETADNAPQFCSGIEPWTPAQVESLVRLGRWLKRTHNIPARICRTPTDAGFGWHGMWDNTSFEFSDGTTPWTPAAGKQCPCPRRVTQLKNTILPRIFAATDPTDEGDGDLTSDQAKQLAEIHTALFAPHAINPGDPIDNLFDRVNQLFNAAIVPGTLSPEEAVNKAFDRLRAVAKVTGAEASDVTDLFEAIAASEAAILAAVTDAKDAILTALAAQPPAA